MAVKGRSRSYLKRTTNAGTLESWKTMMRRCHGPLIIAGWGGRGISVCERWRVFENFLDDMGPKPPYKTLDRIDNDGNYEPGNCRWATSKQQINNTRIQKRNKSQLALDFYGRSINKN